MLFPQNDLQCREQKEIASYEVGAQGRLLEYFEAQFPDCVLCFLLEPTSAGVKHVCCSWESWSQCSRSCGGGSQTRYGYCGIWWGRHSETQSRTCNEFCYNSGSFYGGHCHCSAWRSGSCCQTCRHINIAQCKHGKQDCGGSPDNIKCTECERYYVPAGYGHGCKRCQHNYVVDRGVPKCACKDGFKLSSNGYSCFDVDECVVGNSHCNQICSNTVGSFKCSCRQGYTLDSDGQTCSDIDECLTGVAKCEQKCINLPGSYSCSCRPGFTLLPNGSCTDINECSRNNGGCMQNCVNEPGSFHCECRDGFRLESQQLSCVGKYNFKALNIVSWSD
ncbi:fibulin-1-like [Ruditapes philippinarum]|uniref:fibulin-1-like n=1 Tax=Ruditapes philippinarum TaxID=129788 RepID=UPI00295BCB3F|nr:fibulin-1-like [Ruditapes philippinarum]